MRINVYQQHGKDHERNHEDRDREHCGCFGEPGVTIAVDVECLPPVGSGIWVQGRKGVWRELTVERYTFGDPQDPRRIHCWATYNYDD